MSLLHNTHQWGVQKLWGPSKSQRWVREFELGEFELGEIELGEFELGNFW